MSVGELFPARFLGCQQLSQKMLQQTGKKVSLFVFHRRTSLLSREPQKHALMNSQSYGSIACAGCNGVFMYGFSSLIL